jgi:predicted PurR-regulated permease PerM
MAVKKKSKPKKLLDGIVISNFPGYFLVACLIVTGGILLGVFWPFLTTLILAAILATAFYPLYQWILKLFKNREILASLVTCFLIVVLIIVPLFIFIVLLGRQAVDAYDFVQEQVKAGVLDDIIQWANDFIAYVREMLKGLIDIESIDIKSTIIDLAQSFSSFLVDKTSDILKSFLWILFSFLVLMFSLFFMFKDADKIISRIMTLSPLPDEHEAGLLDKFEEISHATLYGIFLTAIVQGILGGIGFAIAGIPNALFWGTTIAVFSLVPFIGTGAVWFPAAVILLLGQHWFGGIFLLLWGALIVSTVDNFLRAYLIGERTKMNQLLMFLAIIGGIWFFEGLVGIIFGPLVLSLFFAFVHIYEMEYDKVLHRK